VVAAPPASGCVIGARPLVQPRNDKATVMLISAGLGRPMEKVAHHPWFAGRLAGESDWRLWGLGDSGTTGDPFTNSPYEEPSLIAVWRGAEAERAIECLEREAPRWIDDLEYRLWPGPNSNTFGDAMLLACDLHASQPATAIGKDWRGWVGASWTTEGTGFQVETPLVGLRLGLKEGIEVHVLALPFGIDLWPPAIILPIGVGRLGFADR
jgi:hypothetical protein